MVQAIFAHFVAEAPHEEIRDTIVVPSAAAASSASSSSAPISIWRGRIPLYRHLMALDLNVDAATGLPRPDSLVDATSTIYLMRAFPSEYKNDDILRLFETYVSSKRKMADASEDMRDVGEEAVTTAQPSDDIVTAAPKIQWIDDQSVFLTVPVADTDKMDAFLVTLVADQKTEGSTIPSTIEISKFAQPI